LNFVAICIAIFGVYQSVIRDYEQQRDETRDLRRQLDDCRQETKRLLEAQTARPSGMSISGNAHITVDGDLIGGEKQIGRDANRAGRDATVLNDSDNSDPK